MTLFVVRNKFVTRKNAHWCVWWNSTSLLKSPKNSIFSDICTQTSNLQVFATYWLPNQKFFMCYNTRKSENIAQHHTNNSTFHNITHICFWYNFYQIFLPQKKFFLKKNGRFPQKKSTSKKIEEVFSAASNFFLFYLKKNVRFLPQT